MHKINLSETIRARARRLHGCDHPYQELDVAKTAHLVIDMQVGFLKGDGPVSLPNAREILPNVNAISRAVRAKGGLNVFVRFTFDPKDPWVTHYESLMSEPLSRSLREEFTRGSHSFELCDALDVSESDPIVDKTRFSPFTRDSSVLDTLLRQRGMDTVIVTGLATNGCCECTARDAHQLGYKVIFIADANAAMTDEEHNATLNNLMPHFADVMTTREILAAIADSGQKGA
jgi:ureidoacrylate peracid hydrolase